MSLNFHRFIILFISCDTRSVGLGQHCIPKVSTGFNIHLCASTTYNIGSTATHLVSDCNGRNIIFELINMVSSSDSFHVPFEN